MRGASTLFAFAGTKPPVQAKVREVNRKAKPSVSFRLSSDLGRVGFDTFPSVTTQPGGLRIETSIETKRTLLTFHFKVRLSQPLFSSLPLDERLGRFLLGCQWLLQSEDSYLSVG